MALASYSDLQTTIANYLQRSDLTSFIPDFVVLCETKVRRYLRTMEIQATRSQTQSTETSTLPTDFLELGNISLSFTGISYTPEFVMPERLDDMKRVTPTTQGVPRYFTIRLGKIEYYPAPQAGTTFTELLTYFQKIVALATTSPNWLLTNHPDVYLYGSLTEAEAFIQDDPRIALWKAGYDEAIQGVCRMDDRKRFFKPVSVELGLPGGTIYGRPSIESGFW